jgi:hypothetical protein
MNGIPGEAGTYPPCSNQLLLALLLAYSTARTARCYHCIDHRQQQPQQRQQQNAY